MERWIGKVAVVTGASSGIGACICKRLVEENLQVVGLARGVDKVQELCKQLTNKPGKLHAIKCDVSNNNEVVKVFSFIEKNIGPVYILINNAGLFKSGTILDGNPEDWKTVLDTNVLGLTQCSQQAMQQMKKHNIEGHIIHINSLAGHTPEVGIPPILNIYSPSKYSVTALTDVMRQELDYFKLKIKVTSISPGLVATNIFENAGNKADIKQYPHLKTKDVTDAVMYVLSTGPHVQIYELTIAPMGENHIKFD